MKTNPGGQLAVDEVLGRSMLVQNIRDTLEQQSVIITAERRIGKTSIMKIIEDCPGDNWVPIYSDLEKIHSVSDFAEAIYITVQKYLSKSVRAKNIAAELYKGLGGTEVKGFKLPQAQEKRWQETIESSIAALAKEQKNSGKQVLFLWDEVPYLLFNISANDGESSTMQLLDLLRSLRKDYENFRILITGSIGLHHIIDELNKKGYRNEPVNDLFEIEVGPLASSDARLLAQALLEGEAVKVDDLAKVTKTIAQQTDNFPFYIHHIVKSLKLEQLNATAEQVERIILQKLTDDTDPWELKHFDTRIRDYYGTDESTVKLMLDELALQGNGGLTAKKLLEKLKQQSDFDNLENLRELLVKLNLDHYLSKDTTSRYRFRFPLIQRWWILHRELAT